MTFCIPAFVYAEDADLPEITVYPSSKVSESDGNSLKTVTTNSSTVFALYGHSTGTEYVKAVEDGTYDSVNNAWGIRLYSISKAERSDNGVSYYASGTTDGTSGTGNLSPTAPYTAEGGGTCYEVYMTFDVVKAGYYKFSLEAGNYKQSTLSEYSTKMDDGEWISFNNTTFPQTNSSDVFVLHEDVATYYLSEGEHTLTFRVDSLAVKSNTSPKQYMLQGMIKYFKLSKIYELKSVEFESESYLCELGDVVTPVLKGFEDEEGLIETTLKPAVVTYESDNEDVACVLEDGSIKITGSGSCNITASVTAENIGTFTATTTIFATIDNLYAELDGYYVSEQKVDTIPSQNSTVGAKINFNNLDVKRDVTLIIAEYKGNKMLRFIPLTVEVEHGVSQKGISMENVAKNSNKLMVFVWENISNTHRPFGNFDILE